jgi:hypothetical protein
LNLACAQLPRIVTLYYYIRNRTVGFCVLCGLV